MPSENIDNNPEKKFIPLKEIVGLDDYSKEKTFKTIETIEDWIAFYSKKAAGENKVSAVFFVNGFSDSLFDLSTAKDITDKKFREPFKEPHLFISDLINFLFQIQNPLPKIFFGGEYNNISLNLSRLGNIFEKIGVHVENQKISIKDLERIENYETIEIVLKHIEQLKKILNFKSEEEAEVEKTEEPQEEVGSQKKEEPVEESRVQYIEDKEKEENTDEGNKQKQEQPLKISELEPKSRLYLQSLSIITINQALTRYFNAESLEKLGLPPNTRITFDQLPLEIRQQLMDRAFTQVENLLLGGNYSIADLIKNPSQRIAFSSETALSLLVDLRGLNLLNQAVREIAQAQNKQEKIAQNEEKDLTDQDLKQRVKNEKENILNTKDAEELFEKTSSNENIDEIVRNLESKINVFNDAGQLDQELIRQLGEILNNREPTKITEATYNIIPFIDLFIQQGLPPEYIIPDPKNFDYNRFINIFGKTLEESEFNQHREELANLIVFYWKRKRAIWSRDIRREFGIEKYTPEQAQKLFEEVQKHPEFSQRIRELALIDRSYDSTAIATAYADGQQTGIKEFDEFQQYQKDLIDKFLQEHLAKLDKDNQQQTLKVYFEFYQPGVEYETYNIEIFEQQIVPQISPMDFYMLQAAESFGYSDEYGPSFTRDGNGYVQQAFSKDRNIGSEFANSTLGRAANGLAAEAIGDALYAIPGFGEALMAAEVAAPIIKKLKNEAIGKILQWLEEHWKEVLLFVLLSALLSLIMSLLPALLLLGGIYMLYHNGLPGLQKLFSGAQSLFKHTSAGVGLDKGSVASKAALGKTQTIGAGASATSKLALGKLTPAMITAGQAVITTVAAGTFLGYLYRENLNLAFLTNFNANESDYMSSIEKTSKYAKINKTAKITKGCSSPENDGTKCENPSFPLSIEYTITIEPKEDFAIQITDISDELKFKQSSKGWEDSGQPTPTINSGRTLGFDYFKGIIGEQGGISNNSLQDSSTTTDTTVDPSTIDTETNQENIVILPGQKLTFTYSLDDLESIYNHTAIINTIEASFYYKNNYISGTDSVITAARVCLGDCSAGAGCWPTTGSITQLPFGIGTLDKDASHRPPLSGGYSDAYDIGGDGGHPNVYVPFSGDLCFKGCSDTGYGCYYVLSTSENKLLFAHFESPNSQLNQAGSCMAVEEGFLIGPMGTRGNSTGVHLHYEVDYNSVFYSPISRSSILQELVPETDDGSYPAELGDHVTTCYE